MITLGKEELVCGLEGEVAWELPHPLNDVLYNATKKLEVVHF